MRSLFSAILIFLALTGRGKEPPPVSQEDLYRLIDQADRLEVWQNCHRPQNILYRSDRQTDRDELKKALLIDVKHSRGRCMCFGTASIVLYRNNKEIGKINNQHGQAVRYTGGRTDATLLAPEKYLSWFDARGIHQPRQEVEEQQNRNHQQLQAWQKWRQAAPSGLKSLLGTNDPNGMVLVRPDNRKYVLELSTQQQQQLVAARGILDRDFSDPAAAIAALLRWYGSGDKWNRTRSYEDFPAALLQTYEPVEILKTASDNDLTPEQMEGFLRYYCCFGLDDQSPLPAGLQQKATEYYRRTSAQPDLSRRTRLSYLLE